MYAGTIVLPFCFTLLYFLYARLYYCLAKVYFPEASVFILLLIVQLLFAGVLFRLTGMLCRLAGVSLRFSVVRNKISERYFCITQAEKRITPLYFQFTQMSDRNARLPNYFLFSFFVNTRVFFFLRWSSLPLDGNGQSAAHIACKNDGLWILFHLLSVFNKNIISSFRWMV